MTLGHVTRDGEAQRIAWLGGSEHKVLLDGDATQGRVAMFRSSMSGGSASPVHVHEHDDETVYLLSGTATFWAGDRRWDLGAGDTAFLPRSLPHTYVITSEQSEFVTVCNPAGMEEFFRAVGWDLDRPLPEDWQVDLQDLAAAGAARGQHVLGPPLRPGQDMPAELLTERP